MSDTITTLSKDVINSTYDMEQPLSTFNLPIDKFYQLLKGTNALMAGSAPLSVLLGGIRVPIQNT
jgi:hypothetical protein